MLNLQETAERASKYRTYASYGLWVAWGLTAATVWLIGATAWSYHINNLPVRAEVILVSGVFFTAPAIVGWWIREILRGIHLRASNRALRMTNRTLLARLGTALTDKCPDATCRHCATVKISRRADAILKARAEDLLEAGKRKTPVSDADS